MINKMSYDANISYSHRGALLSRAITFDGPGLFFMQKGDYFIVAFNIDLFVAAGVLEACLQPQVDLDVCLLGRELVPPYQGIGDAIDEFAYLMRVFGREIPGTLVNLRDPGFDVFKPPRQRFEQLHGPFDQERVLRLGRDEAAKVIAYRGGDIEDGIQLLF